MSLRVWTFRAFTTTYVATAILLLLNGCNSMEVKKEKVVDKPVVIEKEIWPARLDVALTLRPPTDSEKLWELQMQDGSKMNITELVKNADNFEDSVVSVYDMDGDGKQELILRDYTGGAHCCYIDRIFVETSPQHFKEIFNVTAGSEVRGNTVTVNLYEYLGYFFTCFACEIPDNYPAPEMNFVYKNGAFQLHRRDSLDNDIRKTLTSLAKNQIAPLPADDADTYFDEGERKAYACCVVTWYYNHDRDIKSAKGLFHEYYKVSDSTTVWKSLAEAIADTDQLLEGIVIKK